MRAPPPGRLSHPRSVRAEPPRAGRLAVFAPSPILTVTIEARSGRAEVHLHPGGQGFWVARMAANLEAEVVLCCTLGGEPGRVLSGLMDGDPLVLRAAEADTPNGLYIHDRRSGDRVEIVNVDSQPLTRHAADERYGITLAAGLDADVTLITGSQPDDVVEADLYRRLVSDLRANGKTVIADLTGAPLRAVLEGGIDLLKLSSEELLSERLASSESVADIVAAGRRVQQAGARTVLVSRGADPAILVEAGGHPTTIQLSAPVFEALDHRGAGDSMFAAIGVALARGMDATAAARLGMAAGALNVTRRGLGTGTRYEIERLVEHVSQCAVALRSGGERS